MTLTVGLLHVLTGVAYFLGIGVLSVVDLYRIIRRTGRIQLLGVGLMGMGFTCGPHHLEHGLHVLDHTVPADVINLIAVAVALPPGVIFLGLRIEGLLGGGGDRTVVGWCRTVRALPFVLAVYFGTLVAIPLSRQDHLAGSVLAVLPQVALVILYALIGYLLWTTQFAHNWAIGRWSLSGLSLAALFPTCAASHAHYAAELGHGRISPDIHLTTIDAFGVLAAAVFLTVVGVDRLHHREDT